MTLHRSPPWLPSAIATCLALASAGAFAQAQQTSATDAGARPVTALVLSGGGARGAAHVGVIRVLEDLRVPVDIVVGTSMGAVVGGLYASGLNAGELEAAIAGSDWSALFEDRPPRAERSYRRKTDDLNFLVDFDLGLSDEGLILPPGLVQGQKLTLALRRLSLPVATVRDFNQLPIPFRAIATDIETGELVALGEGDLALSMRASMSAPGVFNPVRIDDRVLVDGGIASNLPVSIARELGAERLIVVNVGFPLLKEGELDSAVSVTSQMLTILIQAQTQDELALLEEDDVLIEPQLERFGSQQFERSLEAVEQGRLAALSASDRIRTLSVSSARYAEFRERVTNRQQPAPVIRHVQVTNDSKLAPRLIERRLEDPIGKPLDVSALEADIADIYGFDTFESVDYRLEALPDGASLDISAREKSWGPNFVRFGVNIEEDFSGTNDYNIAARLTMTELNRLGGELRFDAQLGSTTRLFGEWFQPLDYAGRWFVNPSAEVSQIVTPVYEDGNRVAEFRTREALVQMAVGRQFGNRAEMRLTLSRGYGDSQIATGDPVFGQSNVNSAGVLASVGYDTIDAIAIPRSGTVWNAGFLDSRESLGAEVDFRATVATVLKPQTWGRNTLLHWWDFGRTVDAPANSVRPFALGGLFSLSGYARQELNGRHLGMARMLYYRRMTDATIGPFGSTLYLGASIEAGNVWENSDDIGFDNMLTAGSVFLVLDTFAGPLYLAYGEAEGSRSSVYLFLGQTF